MQLKYLITGTGRCGTVFMARFLTSLGIPCGHESIFGHQGINLAKKRLNGEAWPDLSYCSKNSLKSGEWVPEPSWLDDVSEIEAESSYMAAPFLAEDCLRNTKIIHVVRNPKEVVHSFCNYINYFEHRFPTNEFEEFIYGNIKELTEDIPQYDRACLFYIKWNNLIDGHSHLFYRIEDKLDCVFDFLKIKKENYFSNTSINSHKKATNDFFEIHLISDSSIKKDFVNLGRKYGYRMSVPLIF
jgi:hypothetical protein